MHARYCAAMNECFSFSSATRGEFRCIGRATKWGHVERVAHGSVVMEAASGSGVE